MAEGRQWGENSGGWLESSSTPYSTEQTQASLPLGLDFGSYQNFKNPLVSNVYSTGRSHQLSPSISKQDASHGQEKLNSTVKAKIRKLAESRSKNKIEGLEYEGISGLHRSLSDPKLNRYEDITRLYGKKNEGHMVQNSRGFEMNPEMRSKSVTMLAKEYSSPHLRDIYGYGRMNGLTPVTNLSPPIQSPPKYDGLSKSWGSEQCLNSAISRSVNQQQSHHHIPVSEAYNINTAESRKKLDDHHRNLLNIYSKSGVLDSSVEHNIQKHKAKRDKHKEKRHSIDGIPSSKHRSDSNSLFLNQQKYTDPYLQYLGNPLFPHNNLHNPYLMNGQFGHPLKSHVGKFEDVPKRKKKKIDTTDGVIPKKKKKIKVLKNGNEKMENLYSEHLGEFHNSNRNEDRKVMSKEERRKSLQANSAALLQMQAKVHKLLGMKDSESSDKPLPNINGLKSPPSVIKDPSYCPESNLKWDMNVISPNKTVDDIPKSERMHNKIPDCCGVCKDRGVRYSPQCLNKISPNFSDTLDSAFDKKSEGQMKNVSNKESSSVDLSPLNRNSLDSLHNDLIKSEDGCKKALENRIEELLASAVEERKQKNEEDRKQRNDNFSDKSTLYNGKVDVNLPYSGNSCNMPQSNICSNNLQSPNSAFSHHSSANHTVTSASDRCSDFKSPISISSSMLGNKTSPDYKIAKSDLHSSFYDSANLKIPSPIYTSSSEATRTIARSTSLDDLRSSAFVDNSLTSKNEKIKHETSQENIFGNANVPSVSEAEKENINSDNYSKAATTSNISSHSTGNSSSLPETKTENVYDFKEEVKSPKLEQLAWVADRVQKLKSMISGEDILMDRLKKNIKVDIPACSCRGPDYIVSEDVEGPYYTHLGAARSIQAVREMMEKRTGFTGKAIRIEKVRYTGKEGKSSRGCPIAKWIIRRSGPDEKYLCLVRHRQGHYCETACIVIVTVAWEGVPMDVANDMYSYLVTEITKNGFETERRCGTNERRTCACQGVDLAKRGASFSFGCSWSMYFNGCKFARSREVRKFKLKDTSKETDLEARFQNLATIVAPLYKQMAPDAYRNQTQFEDVAKACRLGNEEGRPFSGVTACVDFCAHAHKDLHNMNNGSTVVVTLTKHRGFDKPDDEQLHVLPLYVMDMTDENGNAEAQFEKIKTGALEVLQQYPLEARVRSEPLTPCKKRGKPKKGGKDKDSPASKKSSPATPKNKSSVSATPKTKLRDYANQSTSDLYYNPLETDSQNSGNKSKNKNHIENFKQKNGGKNRPMSYDDMAVTDKNNRVLYESFWNYFYCFGTFPPPGFVNSWAIQRKGITDKGGTDDFSGKYDTNALNGHKEQDYSCKNPFELTNEMKPSVISHHSTSSSSPSQSSDTHNDAYRGNDQKQNAIGSEMPLDLSSSGSGTDLKAGLNLIQKSSVDANNEMTQKNCGLKDKMNNQKSNPDSISSSDVYDSPLHLLSEAVFLRTRDTPQENGQQQHPHTPSNLPQNLSIKGDNSSNFADYHKDDYFNNSTSSFRSSSTHSIDNSKCNNNMNPNSIHPERTNANSVNQTLNSLGANHFHPSFANASGSSECSIDPTVVKCELEYNKEAFQDSELGGVAVALCHGAVLFEVAKRELHATTGLRNPNRYAPTRVSLVFYQHKNLNRPDHGWYEYEQKLEMLKQSRLEKLNEDKNSILPALDLPNLSPLEMLRKKKKGKKNDKTDVKPMPSTEYKYMWEGPLRRAVSLTTDSVITRWIDPQPMVTGPYQRWV